VPGASVDGVTACGRAGSVAAVGFRRGWPEAPGPLRGAQPGNGRIPPRKSGRRFEQGDRPAPGKGQQHPEGRVDRITGEGKAAGAGETGGPFQGAGYRLDPGRTVATTKFTPRRRGRSPRRRGLLRIPDLRAGSLRGRPGSRVSRRAPGPGCGAGGRVPEACRGSRSA